MPIREVALFRGINVGRAKRVAMADLRQLAADLGYGEVSTLLNSGNLIYTAPRRQANPAQRLQRAMHEALGVDAPVTALSAAEVAGMEQCVPRWPGHRFASVANWGSMALWRR